MVSVNREKDRGKENICVWGRQLPGNTLEMFWINKYMVTEEEPANYNHVVGKINLGKMKGRRKGR